MRNPVTGKNAAEAAVLIKEVNRLLTRVYYNSNLAPTDISKILESLSRLWQDYQIELTREKFSGGLNDR